MLYIDSSIPLEIYLSQARAAAATALLTRPDTKVSSWLLTVEVPIVLRRLLSRKTDDKLLSACLSRFDSDIESISIAFDVADIASRVRQDRRFSTCRTLDAIHAATALQLQQMVGHPVHIATFDKRLEQLALTLGLGVA